MIQLDLGSILEHRLERGASTLRGFRLRNRQDLVRIHKGIRTLTKEEESATTPPMTDGRMCENRVRTGYAM